MIMLAIQQDGICIACAMSNYLPRNSRQLDTDSELEQFASAVTFARADRCTDEVRRINKCYFPGAGSRSADSYILRP
jgi:hypothetical protein